MRSSCVARRCHASQHQHPLDGVGELTQALANRAVAAWRNSLLDPGSSTHDIQAPKQLRRLSHCFASVSVISRCPDFMARAHAVCINGNAQAALLKPPIHSSERGSVGYLLSSSCCASSEGSRQRGDHCLNGLDARQPRCRNKRSSAAHRPRRHDRTGWWGWRRQWEPLVHWCK